MIIVHAVNKDGCEVSAHGATKDEALAAFDERYSRKGFAITVWYDEDAFEIVKKLK